MDNTNFRSPCPAASALDVLGDRWSLLLIRDLLMGKRRYADFQASAENISTNILADRLKTLIGFQIVERRLYQTRPNRYEYNLTQRGADLIPILQSVCAWGMKHVPNCWTPPDGFFNLTPEGWWKRNGWPTTADSSQP